MGKINGLRVIAGGLAAGALIDTCEFVVNGILLQHRWSHNLRALGKAAALDPRQAIAFAAWGLMVGLFAVWLYAAIRPRYGAGPRTAVMAGVAVWVLAYLLGGIQASTLHIFSRHLIVYGIVIGLAESVAGTLLGAWIYKEEEAAAPQASSAGAGN
jgi:hypothetical protein